MYSIDLKQITLDEFETMLSTTHLLPSQRSILKDLSVHMEKLKVYGLNNLFDIQNLLKNKNKYPAITDEIDIDKDYLTILNRMVNSYVVKALPMDKVELFSDEELRRLANEKIKNTKDYYEAFIFFNQRELASKKINIPLEKIEYTLRIIDLLRINGVGVQYAKMLYDIGVKSVADYNSTSSEVILGRINELNKDKVLSKATLGISDIDYCRRFCEKLDCDIKG